MKINTCNSLKFKTELVEIKYDLLVLDEKVSLLAPFYYLNSPDDIQDNIYKAGLLRSFLEGKARVEGYLPWEVHLFFICSGGSYEKFYETIHTLNINTKVLDLIGVSCVKYSNDFKKYISGKENSLSKNEIMEFERFFSPLLFNLRKAQGKEYKDRRNEWSGIVRDKLKKVTESKEDEDDEAILFTVPQMVKDAVKKDLGDFINTLTPEKSEKEGKNEGQSEILKKIDNVKISGFRRLRGVDLQLDNYNILYGPNGTGKTSILESLELGLTGDISRLIEIDKKIKKREKEQILNLEEGGFVTICFQQGKEDKDYCKDKQLPIQIDYEKPFCTTDDFKGFCLSQEGIRSFIVAQDKERAELLLQMVGIISEDLDEVFTKVYEDIKNNIAKKFKVFNDNKTIIKTQKDLSIRLLENLERIIDPEYKRIYKDKDKRRSLVKLTIDIGFAAEGPGFQVKEQIDSLFGKTQQICDVADVIVDSLKIGKQVEERRFELLKKYDKEIRELKGSIQRSKYDFSLILQEFKYLMRIIDQKHKKAPEDKELKELENIINIKKREVDTYVRLLDTVKAYTEAYRVFKDAVNLINKARDKIDLVKEEHRSIDHKDFNIEFLNKYNHYKEKLEKHAKELDLPHVLDLSDINEKAFNELLSLSNSLEKEKDTTKKELTAIEPLLKTKPFDNKELEEKVKEVLEKLKFWLKIEGVSVRDAKYLYNSQRIDKLETLFDEIDRLPPGVIMNVDEDGLGQLLTHYYDLPNNNNRYNAGICYWLYKWKLLHVKQSEIKQSFQDALNIIITGEVEQVFREILWALTAECWTYPMPKFILKNHGIFSLEANNLDTSNSAKGNMSLKAIYNTAEQNLVCLAWFFTFYLYSCSKKSKVIILDDPFQSLDDVNLNNFVRNLDRVLQFIDVEQLVLSIHQHEVARYLFDLQGVNSPFDMKDEAEDDKKCGVDSAKLNDKVNYINLWRKNREESNIKKYSRKKRQKLQIDMLEKDYIEVLVKSITSKK